MQQSSLHGLLRSDPLLEKAYKLTDILGRRQLESALAKAITPDSSHELRPADAQTPNVQKLRQSERRIAVDNAPNQVKLLRIIEASAETPLRCARYSS